MTIDKWIIITVLASLNLAFYYSTDHNSKPKHDCKLQTLQFSIDDYELLQNIPLRKEHLDMLELDDYIFANFTSKNGEVITLYIGYYLTPQKAYSAHSPLVCYPSQGWEITSPNIKKSLALKNSTIRYNEVTVSNYERSELVWYWYQTGGFSSYSSLTNKFKMGLNRLLARPTGYAFVRVSIPINNGNNDDARAALAKFMRAFYPALMACI